MFRKIKVFRPDRFPKPVRSLDQNIYLKNYISTQMKNESTLQPVQMESIRIVMYLKFS